MRILVRALAVALVIGTTPFHSLSVSAADYRQEIMEHVFRPCYAAVARRTGLLDYLKEDEAVLALMIMQEAELEQAVDGILPYLQDKTYRQRLLLYRFSRETCINRRSGG